MPQLARRKHPRQKRPKGKDPHQTHRWHEYSRQYLKKNRLCVKCLEEGITHISQATDHIIPIIKGGDIWNPSNHQALCFKHHNQKTANENKGWNKI